MDEAGEVEVVTDSIDHPLVGKRISFRAFGSGEAMSGTVTDAVRDVTGTVYLLVSTDTGEIRIAESAVMGVEFTEMQAEQAGE